MKFINAFKIARVITLAKIFKQKIPLRVKHRITYRCNLSCPFCRIRNKLNQYGNLEMNTLQIKKMMKEFKGMGTRFWLFSGGEPFLREDLGELVAYAKDEMNFHCSIATNGTLLAGRMEKEPSFKHFDLVQISLDGPQEIHDKVRNNKIYDKVILSLDILRDLHIKTVVMVLLSKYNLVCLNDIIEIARRYNATVAFQALDTQDISDCISKEDFFPDKATFNRAIEGLIKAKEKNPAIISSLQYLKMLSYFWPAASHKIKCYAGQLHCELTPEGSVVPCCVKLGQLETHSSGLKGGFQRAFFALSDMSACRDCYCAGPQELNIILDKVPFAPLILRKI